MTQTKTKKALLMSVLSMVLCVAMLVGMTFAWFTDTASTGVNKIQAGNLKMEVTYKNSTTKNEAGETEFRTLTEETNVFMEDTLWEPGHVEYAVLNVKNVGNLALKYKLGINIASETPSMNAEGKKIELSNYIRFAVVGGDLSGKTRAELIGSATGSKLIKEGYSKASSLKAAQDTAETTLKNEETVTLVVWMPESVGNEANYIGNTAPSIDLGINVAATQLSHENDSYGPNYDQNAKYPVGSADEFATAIGSAQDGDAITLTGAVDFSGQTVPLDKNITISGNGATAKNVYFEVADGKDVTFEGINISDTTTIRAVDDANLSFSNCKFEVTPQKKNGNGRAAAIIGNHQYSNVDLTLEGCTFNYKPTLDDPLYDTYNMAVFMWSNVKNVLIKNCQFNGYGFVAVKFLEMKAGANIVFEGNTFNMGSRTDDNWYWNTAVQIHSVNQPTGECNVSFINNTFTGDYQTGAESEYAGYKDSTKPIVAELLWNAKDDTPLKNTVLTISGNTVNGTAVTEDNFVFIKGTGSSVK